MTTIGDRMKVATGRSPARLSSRMRIRMVRDFDGFIVVILHDVGPRGIGRDSLIYLCRTAACVSEGNIPMKSDFSTGPV